MFPRQSPRQSHRQSSRRTSTVVAGLAATVAAAALTVLPGVADAGRGRPDATYRITIENVATGSQPLSPAGVVIHARSTDVFSTGSPATAAVAAVAEDADLPVFVGTYSRAPGVSQALVGGAAPIAPGASTSFEVTARPGSRLSLVSMLVNTNDAFTGLDSVELGKGKHVYRVGAYDAGTEVDNELASHIPGPAGGNPFVRDPEGGVVTRDHGIVGVGDLDVATYDWNGPVARITIERIG